MHLKSLPLLSVLTFVFDAQCNCLYTFVQLGVQTVSTSLHPYLDCNSFAKTKIQNVWIWLELCLYFLQMYTFIQYFLNYVTLMAMMSVVIRAGAIWGKSQTFLHNTCRIILDHFQKKWSHIFFSIFPLKWNLFILLNLVTPCDLTRVPSFPR